jgi:dipeptide/tripeptide permease
MMVGVLLAVAGALIPAVLIAMLAGFALQAAAGAAPLVVMAAILSMVLIGECLLAVVGLGAALDRTDISEVDAPA